MAAETILALQTIASRERSPLEPVVVTVGKIEGGTKRNIIPDEVRLYLTVRTFSPEVRKRVLESIERIPKGIALVAGVPEDRAPLFEHADRRIGRTRPFNDPALTDRVSKADRLASSARTTSYTSTRPWSAKTSAASATAEKSRRCFWRWAPADPAKLADGTQPGLHSSKFAPADPSLVLRTGVRGAVSMVMELLGKP